MAARAMWKGALVLPDVRVAVKLYAAVQDRKVRFHLLHDKDLERVEQRMVDPEESKEVAHEETRKGFVGEDGVVVALEEEELAELAPEPSRDVELLRFVPRGAIDHAWYDRPYWLGPDGEETAYASLVAALKKREREGVARWVMRGREYVGALRAEGDHLLLLTLRRAEEVVRAEELPAPGGRGLDAKEKRLAEGLVGALAGPFEPEEYRDTFRARLREIIAAKAEGKPIETERPAQRKTPDDLEGALAASLARARGEEEAPAKRRAAKRPAAKRPAAAKRGSTRAAKRSPARKRGAKPSAAAKRGGGARKAASRRRGGRS
jgi:DNA end-binding protein Ku